MGRQPCGHPNPQVGRRGDDPARSPGRPAVTDLGFRAQKLRARPRERGRSEDGPCGGPALPARAGSGGADARKRPRRRPAAHAHLSPSPRVGRRRAQARRGRGRSRERRVGPAPQSCTAPGASPPERSRYRRRRRHRFCCRLSFQDGRPRGGVSRASSSGARLAEAAALDGQAEVACISLSPPFPGGRSSRRMRTDRQLRGAENELRQVWSNQPRLAVLLVPRPHRCQRSQSSRSPHPARSPPHDPLPSAGKQAQLEGNPRGAGMSPAQVPWYLDPPTAPFQRIGPVPPGGPSSYAHSTGKRWRQSASPATEPPGSLRIESWVTLCDRSDCGARSPTGTCARWGPA
ncbi:serine/arginine repetitive matrix protein 1-like [Ovis canadensis]|uniref:serine/arginine repetitive matrix protein 1-like n=1 Tax=Ovis canadensis TaxID=37174 RepID=UPI0037517EC3